MWMNKLLVIILVRLGSVLSADPLPNIGYLASGYDIFYGNPRSTQAGVDPGFQTAIFHFSYESGSTTSDRRYLVPDHTTFRKDVGCSIDFQSDSIQGSKKYKESLEVDVSVSGEVAGVTFSASTDFQSVHEKTSKYNRRYTSSQSVCIAYDGFIDEYKLPAFSENFKAAVKILPAVYNEPAYMHFLQTFGTHYVSRAKMGAKYGVRTEFSESSWETLLSQRIKVELAAGYNGKFSVSPKLVTKREKEEAETFARSSEQQKSFTIGSKPPSDGKEVTWANQALDEPMPINYHLKPVSELFATTALGTLRSDNLAIRSNIERATKAYCRSLQKKGVTSICNGLPDDPKAPVIHNSCRFCAQRCGGYFSVDGGALSQDRQWPKWFQLYPPGCTGSIGHYNVKGHGARFCCEPKDESHMGNGRICRSCGSAYSHFGGAIMTDARWPEWISVYDNHCNGDARHRPSILRRLGYSFCFTEKNCELCVSCGGDFPHETSVMGADVYWPNFFYIRSSRCESSFSSRYYKDGVKVCCRRRGPTQLNSYNNTDTLTGQRN